MDPRTLLFFCSIFFTFAALPCRISGNLMVSPNQIMMIMIPWNLLVLSVRCETGLLL